MTQWIKNVLVASFLCSSLALAACAGDDPGAPGDLQSDEVSDDGAGDEAVTSEQNAVIVYDSCTRRPGYGWETICQAGGKPPCVKTCVCQSYICAN
jgi:hypothetical protein